MLLQSYVSNSAGTRTLRRNLPVPKQRLLILVGIDDDDGIFDMSGVIIREPSNNCSYPDSQLSRVHLKEQSRYVSKRTLKPTRRFLTRCWLKTYRRMKSPLRTMYEYIPCGSPPSTSSARACPGIIPTHIDDASACRSYIMTALKIERFWGRATFKKQKRMHGKSISLCSSFPVWINQLSTVFLLQL